MKLFVLSGTAAEARDFCSATNIPLSSVTYVSHQDQMRGQSNPAFVVVGTFWNRTDASDVWTVLQNGFVGVGTQTFPPFMMSGGTPTPAHKPGRKVKGGKRNFVPMQDTDSMGDDESPVVPGFVDHKTFKKIRTQ